MFFTAEDAEDAEELRLQEVLQNTCAVVKFLCVLRVLCGKE